MGKDLWDRVGPNSSAHGSDSHYSDEAACADGGSADKCSSMAISSSSSDNEQSSMCHSSSTSDDECSTMALSSSSSGDSIDPEEILHCVGGSSKATDDIPEYVVQDILDMRLKVQGRNGY